MGNLFDKNIQPSFTEKLSADSNMENSSRQVYQAHFSYATPEKPKSPSLVHVSNSLLKELEVTIDDQAKFLKLISGAEPFNGFSPYAMCYGGHQFGSWAGQLGDGRAINIAELNIKEKNWKFQLKGAGPTPYSRGSDGLAVLRSSIREYLCSEAMHHLGIPTTRALSIAKTGDLVTRDILYNGNPEDELGAIVCRVSESFVRFGSFEIFNARQDIDNLKKLLDYTIRHHYSHIGEPSKKTYIAFFEEVVNRTKNMIIHWQRVGFVHGVMNTDNMSILGQTIDYGPYGWLEDYNPYWTPNTTDSQHKRYRFGNQPSVALWNLTQLANAIYPLIEEVEPLQQILEEYKASYTLDYHQMMCNKLGIYNSDEIPEIFVEKLTENLTRTEIDMTIFFRLLSEEVINDFDIFWDIIITSSYIDSNQINLHSEIWNAWFTDYEKYVSRESCDQRERLNKMKKVNPKYVLRNYMAQLAIDKANIGDYSLINELYELLSRPYEDQPNNNKWFVKRPEWAKHKVGCSMLSCSS